MILSDLVSKVEQQLLDAELYFGHGTDNAFDEAAWLVLFAAGIDVSSDHIDWQQVLNGRQRSAIEGLTWKRINTRRPLAYLVNQAWFAGYELYVDERAIVPRSHLGELITERFQPWLGTKPVTKVLDLCTGSGCLAVAIALAFSEAQVDAVDLSPAALEVATINIARYAVDSQIRLLEGDLFNIVPDERYDLIVCNPPYVSEELLGKLSREHSFEPRIAFAGGSNGLDVVRRLLAEARRYLTNKGLLFVEAGSAAENVDQTWPRVPFTWLSSASGESVVFTLTAEDLDRYRNDLSIGSA
mgnify:CR=1 FL=1